MKKRTGWNEFGVEFGMHARRGSRLTRENGFMESMALHARGFATTFAVRNEFGFEFGGTDVEKWRGNSPRKIRKGMHVGALTTK